MTDTRGPLCCDHFFAEHTSRYDLRCTRCGTPALDVERGDAMMLEIWAEWARKHDNPGAARLFDRVRFRLTKPAPVPPVDADAERWRWIRQYLVVEDDVSFGGQYLMWNDPPANASAKGFEHTVESLADVARAAFPVDAPEVPNG